MNGWVELRHPVARYEERSQVEQIHKHLVAVAVGKGNIWISQRAHVLFSTTATCSEVKSKLKASLSSRQKFELMFLKDLARRLQSKVTS